MIGGHQGFLLDLVKALNRQLLFCRCLHHFFQQRSNYFVSNCGHADFFVRPHEGANHLCSSVGLSGTGRALDRQHAMIQLERQPCCRADQILVRAA